ncbi:hypothetical protein ZWY2020_017892 [Hordeum vulgare]|nr:hypothetical protein ZWY2020_017892 [Hordeum vulgare]
MSNIQPTRSRGEGTEEVETIITSNLTPPLKPRFVLQGEKEQELAGPPRSRLLRRAPASAACAHGHSGVTLIDKAVRHPSFTF